MIKHEFVKITITGRNKKIYESKLKRSLNINEVVTITTSQLANGSHKTITGVCDICSNERKVSKKAYITQTKNEAEKFTCSKKCSVIKSKQTNIEKYGVDNPSKSTEVKNKIKDSFIKKYGVDNPSKSKQIKNKRFDTNKKKYGFTSASKSNIVKEKVKRTNLDKFGYDYPSQNDKILDKMKKTTLDRYGVDNFSKTNEFKKILYNNSVTKFNNKHNFGELVSRENTYYKIKCKDCNSLFKIHYTLLYTRTSNNLKICTRCNPKNIPIKEKEVYEFVKSIYNGVVMENVRNVINGEIDIFIPEMNLGIEFNGLYWHSEFYKDRKYHLNKTKMCEAKNISLFHIWEDDWDNKKDIVKSILKNKLNSNIKKIGARKCDIKLVTNSKLSKSFLDKNHIQGNVGASIKYGLFHKGELVSLMTFGKKRISLGHVIENDNYELLRFCNKLNTVVIGAATKMFKKFIQEHNPSSVISYSDNSRFNGNVYNKMNFKYISDTGIDYYWVVNGERKHRYNYRKSKLVELGFDSNKTEKEIMHELNSFRIYGCGMKKWLFKQN